MSRKLYEDALNLSINKNLDDVVTLLQWASEAQATEEKMRHITQAVELLQDVRANLKDLADGE